jgi:hypothetical protein
MIVEELLKKLNDLVTENPVILKLKVCGKDNEFRYCYSFQKIQELNHNWKDGDPFWDLRNPSELTIEKILLLK